MATLSDTMDAPLTELMRAAAMLARYPELRGAQERIVASVQVLEATRVTLRHAEDIVRPPPPRTEPPPSRVVDLGAARAARGAVRDRPL